MRQRTEPLYQAADRDENASEHPAAARAGVDGYVPPDRSAQTRAATILLIEDDPEIRNFVSNVLGAHYALIMAANGDDGRRKAAKNRPELILADAEMSSSAEGSLAEELKAAPETAELPLIVLTSRPDPESTARALRGGADDHIDKPFSAAELIARVDLHLRLRRATARALETERLATLGLLSSGFAHDVRNPLNGVINALLPLREQVLAQDMNAALSLIDIVESCSERLGALAQTFLSVGRPARSPGSFQVAEGLDAALKLLHHRIPPKVTVERRYHYAGPIYGHAGLLSEVWINLIDNGLRAVGGAGHITLSVDRAEQETVITVADNGQGIRPEHMERLFQPFFTTRSDGTGLGLALCRRIVQQHKGRIEVRSQPGKGTQFIVSLPVGDVTDPASPRTKHASA